MATELGSFGGLWRPIGGTIGNSTLNRLPLRRVYIVRVIIRIQPAAIRALDWVAIVWMRPSFVMKVLRRIQLNRWVIYCLPVIHLALDPVAVGFHAVAELVLCIQVQSIIQVLVSVFRTISDK